tara:strand:+ start:565 stop:2598 length:2034 start_codon:yes stop_codon:yes gene_type:complete
MIDFNNYEIIRKIGEGAQGEVYLAKDKRLGRKVAIKSLHIDLITNTVLKERFVGEAKLLGQLSHPSIVTLFDYIVDNSGYHLIMEYLKGNQLDDYIKKVSGPINEIRAIDIFLQVLDGISHIHKLNIVHRDIKPSNIIIDQNDQIKLLDFGIAKDYNNDPNLTVVGQSVGGTPMYMSPEHISNAKITVQSDIYSLGVTFWHMLTGKAPYEGQSLAKIYSQIENEELTPIEKIYPFASKKLNDIIKKATAKDPNKRYDSCLSFIRAIQDLKKLLISKINSKKTKLDINPEKNIDIRVKNVEGASFVINQIGHIGTEITFSDIPGTKLNIQIHKEGYESIYLEMVINEDELIEFELKKRMPAFISLILVAFYFLSQNFFKTIIFLLNKKILKLNDIQSNNIYKSLDNTSFNLNNNIKSFKSEILELSFYFGLILITILIFTFSINSSNIKVKDFKTEKVELIDQDEKQLETKPFVESDIVLEPETNLETNSETNLETNSEPYGKLKEDWCRNKGNPPYTRVRVYHDGKGGTYTTNTPNSPKCGYKPITQKSRKNTNSSTRISGTSSNNIKSEFQERINSNVHDFYTDSFNGWKLIIDKSGSDIEIRAYKNGKFFHKYEIKGQLSSISYNLSSNTLNTNWLAGTGKRRHLINLNNTSIPKVSRVDVYWSRKNLKIELKSN